MLLVFQVSQRQLTTDGAPRLLEIFAVPGKAEPPPIRPVERPKEKTRRQPSVVLKQLPPPQAQAESQPAAVAPIAAPLVDELSAPPDAARAPQDGELMHSSRQIARKDDRDARKGKLAPLDGPKTPFAKMQAAMAGAYTGGPVTMSSYTSPDGVVITRINRGGGSKCYMGAGSGTVPSAANSNGYIGSVSGGAREVNCPPADAGWRKQ